MVTDYKTGRLHLSDDMVARFSLALNVTADEILGLKNKKGTNPPDLKITRRVREIEKLPPSQKKSLLNTIDAYLKANSVKENKYE